MAEEDTYSHDTGAIRDVANNDMLTIALDIKNAGDLFGGTGQHVSGAFSGDAMTIFPLLPIEAPPFAAVSEKWNKASDGISTGIQISQARIEDSANGLNRIAERYDDAEKQNVGHLKKVLPPR